MTEHTVVPPLVDDLLGKLWEAGGTDVLLTAGAAPMMRVDGYLRQVVGREVLTSATTFDLMDALLTGEQRALFGKAGEVDFSFSWRGLARIRGNAYWQRGAAAVALRSIPRAIPTLESLG